MSRWDAYLNTGKRIIEIYDGGVPLSAWLKDYYRQHKQMGSRDRKIISQLVYSFYRSGHSTIGLSMEERLLAGIFLSGSASSELLDFFKPTWNNYIQLSFPEKEAFLKQEGFEWQPDSIFPWKEELSDSIDAKLFSQSHLQQPDLFLRIRPNREEIVIHKLTEADISFTRLLDDCIELPNATSLDQVLKIDEEIVIQDYNSQKVGKFFELHNPDEVIHAPAVWDCCAGSGGKSIMAYDKNPAISLTVSDSRASILKILGQRFQRAGINNYHSIVTDLSTFRSSMPKEQFDYIIADVPCTGSGTWGRVPEQLYFFDPQKITHYSELQKKIVSRVIPKLHDNGRLVYITCSVFKKENEEIIDFIRENFAWELEKMELLTGYNMRSDSMFAAVLRKI